MYGTNSPRYIISGTQRRLACHAGRGDYLTEKLVLFPSLTLLGFNDLEETSKGPLPCIRRTHRLSHLICAFFANEAVLHTMMPNLSLVVGSTMIPCAKFMLPSASISPYILCLVYFHGLPYIYPEFPQWSLVIFIPLGIQSSSY